MKTFVQKLLVNSCVATTAALACVVTPVLATSSPAAPGAAAAGQPEAMEMGQTLYVQAPDWSGPKGDSIVLVWLPEPLKSTCVGRTMKECFNIDYCIRTTNPSGPQCSNLGISRARLPHYPPDMQPRRAISIVLTKPGNGNGFALLKDFYSKAPKETLARLSSDATIRARIRYTSTPS